MKEKEKIIIDSAIKFLRKKAFLLHLYKKLQVIVGYQKVPFIYTLNQKIPFFIKSYNIIMMN
ncbi:hypothetical protein A499_08477 [Niallia nealsonii AAU1]|nr:hypothetical protein A499_08477 [Niallia nealsonii AAU1]